MIRFSTILICCILLNIISIHAQQTWTLSQCVDYALEHNLTIRQSQYAQQQALNSYQNSRLAWVPSVSAGVGESFYLGRSMSAENTYVPYNSSNTSISASMSMPVFSGLNIYRQTQASKCNWQAAMADLKAAQEQTELNIMSAYLEILFNKEKVGTAEQQLIDARQQLEKTQILFQSGKVAESEVYESAAQEALYANVLTESQNTLMLSKISLAQLLQLTDVGNFDIVSPDSFALADSLTLTDLQRIIDYATANHPQMQAAQLRLQQSEYQLKNSYTNFIPSLSLSAGYGTGYYYYFASNQNYKFNDQLKQNGSLVIGFQLNIPIWDISNYYNIQNAKIETESRKLDIESTQNALNKEIQTAYYNAVAARQQFFSEERNYQSSKIAYDYAQAKYEAGKSTAYEIDESRFRYYQSASSLLQAKYQYLFCNKILNFYGGK